jgi:pimeloyl-ACP methyl ester carboxylesterase
VIPSLPGFGFSGRTADAGWGTARTAKAWATLMARLGYDRYGAGGNDAGSLISPELARIDADHVVGVHVAQIYSFPSGDPAEFEGMSAGDMAALQKLSWFMDTKFSYYQLHSQQPQTLAHALAPVGVAGFAGDYSGIRRFAERDGTTSSSGTCTTRPAGTTLRTCNRRS